MARPSKTKPFAIYEDAGIPTPPADSTHQPSFDEALKSRAPNVSDDDVFDDHEKDEHNETFNESSVLDDIEEALGANIEPTDDEERRESAVTSTSISSLPESSSETDQERSRPMHKPYTPPMIRPSFRRPQSVQRMQMTSPLPFERSPRRSVHSQSRYGTPRSKRSSIKGSPRPRKYQEEEYVEPEKKEYPLVLLHVTLLPVELRWSMETMQEILPQKTLDNLQVLRSKVTETILQRGILIPHPREEYELLEERLLEALELRKERITKCGHFRSRDSVSSTSSDEGSIQSQDSGVGSSVESDEDLCETCKHHFKTSRTVHGSGRSKWNIRVFAANGLMRASAWVAAWSEMERVDVEIMPWISEDLRRQLDARGEEEDDVDKDLEIELPERMPEAPSLSPDPPALPLQPVITAAFEEGQEPQSPDGELPEVYRAKDVPLSLLLRNYIYLLAQDRKNIVIIGLAALAMFLTLRAALVPPHVDISPLPPMLETAIADTLAADVGRSTARADIEELMELSADEVDMAIAGEPVPDMAAPEPTHLKHMEEAETLEDEDKTASQTPAIPSSNEVIEDTCGNLAAATRLFQGAGLEVCHQER